MAPDRRSLPMPRLEAPALAGRPLRERPIGALPAPYSDMELEPPQTVDPPVLGRVAPVRRVLDASTAPAGPIRAELASRAGDRRTLDRIEEPSTSMVRT